MNQEHINSLLTTELKNSLNWLEGFKKQFKYNLTIPSNNTKDEIVKFVNNYFSNIKFINVDNNNSEYSYEYNMYNYDNRIITIQVNQLHLINEFVINQEEEEKFMKNKKEECELLNKENNKRLNEITSIDLKIKELEQQKELLNSVIEQNKTKISEYNEISNIINIVSKKPVCFQNTINNLDKVNEVVYKIFGVKLYCKNNVYKLEF